MKKIISAIVISIFTLQVQAQGLDFGIKAGLNIANTTTTSGSFQLNTSTVSDFHAGVYMKAALTGKISIQPEIFYSMQGYELGSATVKTSYLQIPVLFRYNFVPIFNIHAGPQYGILLSASSTPSGTTTDSFSSGDFSWVAGLGFDFPMGISVGSRFVQGLSNVNNSGLGLTSKNYMTQIYVSYKLLGAGK
jgi:hypothetical protein